MIKVNEYFEGKVKSLGVENQSGKCTVGVMDAGEYEFSTGAPERMTLLSGKWELQLPGNSAWSEFAVGQTASIAGNSKFRLRIHGQSAYLCQFG